MISDKHTTPIESTTDRQAEHETRLAVKPATENHIGVDGGWWPRSADPAAEFPALITALAGQGRPVHRVSYNIDAWGHADRRITVDGVLVRLEGFRSTPTHIVTMIGPNRDRTRLLVIPANTATAAAETALRAAGDQGSTATAEEILNPGAESTER